jgi:hypothetical protein
MWKVSYPETKVTATNQREDFRILNIHLYQKLKKDGIISCETFLSIRRSFDYPIKLKTTKNKTRQQKAKSPKAFSGVTDLNSDDVVSCNRRETAMIGGEKVEIYMRLGN